MADIKISALPVAAALTDTDVFPVVQEGATLKGSAVQFKEYINAQPKSLLLQALAGTAVAANQGVYATGANAFATYSLTAGGRALGGVAGTANTVPYFSAANTVTLQATTEGGRALWDVAGTANTFPYFSAANTVTLGAVTSIGRSLMGATSHAAARTAVGMTTAGSNLATAASVEAQKTILGVPAPTGLPAAPATDGTYNLQILDGVATWVEVVGA